MKSSRIILLFAAVSIVIHGLVFLVKIPPSESSPLIETEHMIPVELAFLDLQSRQPEASVQAPPPASSAEQKTAELPAVLEKTVPNEPVQELPQPEPVKQAASEAEPVPEPEQEQAAPESASPQQVSHGAFQNSAESSGSAPEVKANPFDDLMQRVEINKSGSYPLRARKRGQQGTVMVLLTLDKDGNMLNVEIIGKSRHSALNTAAIELVEKIMEQPYPHGLDKTVNFKFPITFRLD